MSELNREVLVAAVSAILDAAHEKKRNFLEAVELQVVLKDYDAMLDKRFSGTLILPHVASPNLKVCIIGDAAHCQQAELSNIPFISLEGLRGFNKNKKLIKKWKKCWDCFLASEALIRHIPRILGPGLSKGSKFPKLIQNTDNLELKAEERRREVKFHLKKVLLLGAAVGHVHLSTEELQANIVASVSFLLSLLKQGCKGWCNIKLLRVKATMGKPHVIYATSAVARRASSGPSARKDRREFRTTLQRARSDTQDQFTVFVDAGRNGQRLAVVQVMANDAVVKLRLAAQGPYLHSTVRLFFRGAMLLDDQTMHVCGIHDKAHVLAVNDLAASDDKPHSEDSVHAAEDGLLRIVISTIGGSTVAEFHMERQQTLRELRQRLKQGLDLQYWQQMLVTDDGTCLNQKDDHLPIANIVPEISLLNLKLVYQRDPPTDVQDNTRCLMKLLKKNSADQTAQIMEIIREGRYDANAQAGITRKGNKMIGGQSISQLAVCYSSEQRLLEVTKELLHSNADVNAVDPRGTQALHVACQRGSYECFKVASLLVDKSADVDIVSSGDDTALHLALKHLCDPEASKEYRQIVGAVCCRLISLGADVELKNGQGKSSTQLVQGFLQKLKSQSQSPLDKESFQQAGLSPEFLRAFWSIVQLHM